MTKWMVLVALLAACPGHRATPASGGKGGGGGLPGGGEATTSTAADKAAGAGEPRALLLLDEEPITVGAVDKDTVRKVVKGKLATLQACYERVLLGNPGVAGRVLVTFTIELDGTPHDVTASGVHPEVETCVADAFRAFRFPRPDGKATVTYPFTFKP